MDLDRGTLARIDRKLLAGLGQDEAFQMVRVPVTPAQWSTWKRYCDMVGVSMGRAIVTLIDHELMCAFDDEAADRVPTLVDRATGQMAAREAHLVEREHAIAIEEQRLQEHDLGVPGQRTDVTSRLPFQPAEAGPKIGRNRRCPCGSGLKYKRCHG
jgi:hypothetical protein